MNKDNIAEQIYETLIKQRFVDWYEKVFVPSFVEESGDKQDAIKQIKKVFELGQYKEGQ